METMATYEIAGSPAGMTADQITAILGLEPNWNFRLGRQAMKKADARPWSLSTGEAPTADVQLSARLLHLLDQLHPRRATLWTLANDGCEMTWFCYLGSHSGEGAAELSADLLKSLLDLPGNLMLDAYSDLD